jgi:hypothetical protein
MIEIAFARDDYRSPFSVVLPTYTVQVDTTKGEITAHGQTYRTLGHAVLLQAHTYQTAEHCQYCGNSWQQTRSVGTPRLDAVLCPACKRLV